MVLICIGGREDKDGDMAVLKGVLARAQGARSRVCVVTSATDYPEDLREMYTAAFRKLGVECVVMHLETAAEAADQARIQQIQKADVVFFSGGDQEKLVRVLKGTAFMAAVKSRLEEGAVVAGTSSGAAAMSALMITGGRSESAHLAGAITAGAGFGFVPDVIFDTHFMNRGRLPRLFNLVAAHPEKIGIGLDEDTGVVLGAGGIVEVIGSGAVTVVKDAGAGKPAEVVTLRVGDRFRM